MSIFRQRHRAFPRLPASSPPRITSPFLLASPARNSSQFCLAGFLRQNVGFGPVSFTPFISFHTFLKRPARFTFALSPFSRSSDQRRGMNFVSSEGFLPRCTLPSPPDFRRAFSILKFVFAYFS